MIVTFSYGKIYISQGLFDDLRVPVSVPNPISKKTLEIGTRSQNGMSAIKNKYGQLYSEFGWLEQIPSYY